MKRLFLLIIKLGVLVALLALAVATQNLKEIWTLVAGTNFLYILLFFVLNALSVALASSNLFLLLRPLGKWLPWRRLFYFDLLSLAGAYYTPGGIGGLGTVIFMMNREGVGLKDSTVAVLVDKGVTLLVALFSSAVYMLIYYNSALVVNWYSLAGLVFLAALVAVVMFSTLWIRQSAAKIMGRARCYIGQYRLLIANMIITAGILGLSALQFIVAFAAVGVEVTDWLLIIVSFGVLLLINYLPITFGGIGLGEAAAVFLWASLGIASEQILAVYLVVRLFTLASTLILGGGAVTFWLFERREEKTAPIPPGR